jgi:hypothetical protein
VLSSFPLLAVSLILYVLLSVSLGVEGAPWHERESLQVQLLSGDVWRISAGHLFIALTMVLLFIELLRATKSGSASLLNHALSVLVFVVALLMFITMRGYGNSLFFLFIAMTFLDFMAGFVITTVTARRDMAFDRSSE